jgi:GTP-binding protein
MSDGPIEDGWVEVDVSDIDVSEWAVDDHALEDEEAAALAARTEFGELAAEDEVIEEDTSVLPVVAVIGRPNVGKSTLVNRILGRREAVVEDVPGVTRDRVAYQASWNGRDFMLLDTGGWERDARGMAAQIKAQAERAVREADVAMLIVDATVGATNTEEQFIRVLRGAGIPVLLVANKVDDVRAEAAAAELWSLGLGEPYPVSALHGRGSGDLLDAVLAVLPTEGKGAHRPPGPRRVALLGRPNVGKSSLLNRLAGEARVVVDPVAGTTVDPVDELVEVGGQAWWFVDTAGIRRRVNEASGHEFYASLRTRSALDKAEVAVVLLDSSEVLSEQDTRILTMAVEAGRALVLAFNKWDLVDEERRRYLEREIELDLGQVSWAPRVNVSALTGRHADRLAPALAIAIAGWETRVSTGRLNAFIRELVAAHPHPVRGGKQPRILFATQATTRPPTFVLFTTGFIEAGYRRFVERRLREEFGFEGTPIRIQLRVREKRGKTAGRRR